MKKVIFLFVACAAVLAQCDIWQKPLIEPIVKETKKADEIEKIMVTKYPYPNTFSRDSDTLAVLKNGGAAVWENECALEVSGVTSGGEIRKLTVSEYMVDGFDPAALDDGKYPVTVRLNGAPEVTMSFDIAIVSFNGNYHEVKIAAGISHGTLVPFPSGAKESELVTVYIAPDEGYACREDGISITSPPPPIEISLEETSFTFTMPGGDVTITAEFFKAAAKLEKGGQSAVYYNTLEEAFGGLENGDEAAITLLWDVEEQNSSITVSGNVTLTAAPGAPKTISRGGSPTGSLFTVGSGASLVLNAGDSLGLTLDGKNIPVNAPLVEVSGGALTMGGRVTLRNNNRNDNHGGGVYIGIGGTFNMSGGKISGNTTNTKLGGGVYVDYGTFNMSSGEISGNTSNVGGGVYVNGGTGGGTFKMSGGEISGNTADSNSGGVGVLGGAFTMSGGTVSGNISPNSAGVNISGGTFKMSGGAVVKQEVYLAAGKKINVSGELTPPAGEYSAEIKLSDSTTDGAVVLEGVDDYNLSFGDAAKFKLLNSGKSLSYSDSEHTAKLVSGTPGPTIEAFYSNGGAPIYGGLKTIIENVSGTEVSPAVINIVADAAVELTNTANIASGKHIKLTVPDGEAKTIKRVGGNFKNSLFTVQSGASLTLEAGNGSLTLDGGNINNMAEPLVTVSGGTLTMGNGVKLKNNKINNSNPNNNGGAVVVSNSGTFNMSGGEISNNSTINMGGGVYVTGGSTFNMSGGEISNNSTLSMGGGVCVTNGSTFNMNDGTISGNTATGYGGGIYHGNGTFNMTGGTINGSADPQPNTAPSGAAYYKSSGASSNPSDLASTNNTIIDGEVQ
jgi:hypothetical protein